MVIVLQLKFNQCFKLVFQVHSDSILQLHLITYIDPLHQLSNGSCCTVEELAPNCSTSCSANLSVCYRAFNSSDDTSSCLFMASTGTFVTIGNESTRSHVFPLGDIGGGVSNPIDIPAVGQWPVRKILMVFVIWFI